VANGNGNERLKWLGAVLVGAGALLAAYNAVPWPTRPEIDREHEAFRSDLTEIKKDVREIREWVRDRRRP
jgi:hypothetical protein